MAQRETLSHTFASRAGRSARVPEYSRTTTRVHSHGRRGQRDDLDLHRPRHSRSDERRSQSEFLRITRLLGLGFSAARAALRLIAIR